MNSFYKLIASIIKEAEAFSGHASFRVVDNTAVGTDPIRELSLDASPLDADNVMVTLSWEGGVKEFEKTMPSKEADHMFQLISTDLSNIVSLTSEQKFEEAKEAMKNVLKTYAETTDTPVSTTAPKLNTTQASLEKKADDWKVRYYDKNDKEISSHVIKDRTEHEAEKEATGDMPSDCEDWSMTKVTKKKADKEFDGLWKQAKASIKNTFQTITFDTPDELMAYQEKMKSAAKPNQDTIPLWDLNKGKEKPKDTLSAPSMSYEDVEEEKAKEHQNIEKQIDEKIKTELESALQEKAASVFGPKELELVKALRGVGRNWDEIKKIFTKDLSYDKDSTTIFLDEQKQAAGDMDLDVKVEEEKPEGLRPPENLVSPETHEKLLEDLKKKNEPVEEVKEKEIEKVEPPIKEESAQKCPHCEKDVWDTSHPDQRLNKCWECGTRFDNPEKESNFTPQDIMAISELDEISRADNAEIRKVAMWQDHLQNVYKDLQDFIQWDQMYGLSNRVGFPDSESAWEANPLVQGSTNPADYKVIGSKKAEIRKVATAISNSVKREVEDQAGSMYRMNAPGAKFYTFSVEGNKIYRGAYSWEDEFGPYQYIYNMETGEYRENPAYQPSLFASLKRKALNPLQEPIKEEPTMETPKQDVVPMGKSDNHQKPNAGDWVMVKSDLKDELPAFKAKFVSEYLSNDGTEYATVETPEQDLLEVEMHRVTKITDAKPAAQETDPLATPELEIPQEAPVPVTPKLSDLSSNLKEAKIPYGCALCGHSANEHGKDGCLRKGCNCDRAKQGIIEREQAAEKNPQKSEPNIHFESSQDSLLSIKAEAEALLKLIKEGTGEATQEYDKKAFDEIVQGLQASGYKASHREFDKYQGVYIQVSGKGVNEKFWIEDSYSTGKRSDDVSKYKFKDAWLLDPSGEKVSANRGDYFQLDPNKVLEGYTLYFVRNDDFGAGEEFIENPKVSDLPEMTGNVSEVTPSTFLYEKGTEQFHLILYPESNPEIKIEYSEGSGDVSDIVYYLSEKSTGKISFKFIKKGLEKHADDSAFEGNGWCRVWIQEDEVATSSKYAEILKLPDENARIAALKDVARELAHEALHLADSAASKVGVQSWFDSLKPSDHDRIDWVALANPQVAESSLKQAKHVTKCVKPGCDKELELKDMVKNVHGAGYLCKEHAKDWNKDASLKQASLRIGDQARISGGSGIDSDKIVTIVSPSEIKTDGRGIPTNVQGAYKPVDWSKEMAIKYEDGSIGLMFKNRLFPIEIQASDFEKGISQNKTSAEDKCSKCGADVPRGEGSYKNDKVLCQKCTTQGMFEKKADPTPLDAPQPTKVKDLKISPKYVDKNMAVPATDEMDVVLSKMTELEDKLSILDRAKKEIQAKMKEEMTKIDQSGERVQMEAELQAAVEKAGVLIEAVESRVISWRDKLLTLEKQDVQLVPQITPKQMLEKIYAKFDGAEKYVQNVLNGMLSLAKNVTERTLVRWPNKKSSVVKEASPMDVMNQINEELLAALKELSSSL